MLGTFWKSLRARSIQRVVQEKLRNLDPYLPTSVSLFTNPSRPFRSAMTTRVKPPNKMVLLADIWLARYADSYETGVIRELISMTTYLPPFLGAVTDQVRYDSPPQPDDVVTSRRGPGITGLQTFHVVRHQKCKWHVTSQGDLRTKAMMNC